MNLHIYGWPQSWVTKQNGITKYLACMPRRATLRRLLRGGWRQEVNKPFARRSIFRKRRESVWPHTFSPPPVPHSACLSIICHSDRLYVSSLRSERKWWLGKRAFSLSALGAKSASVVTQSWVAAMVRKGKGRRKKEKRLEGKEKKKKKLSRGGKKWYPSRFFVQTTLKR